MQRNQERVKQNNNIKLALHSSSKTHRISRAIETQEQYQARIAQVQEYMSQLRGQRSAAIETLEQAINTFSDKICKYAPKDTIQIK